jgi:hypothetical protein
MKKEKVKKREIIEEELKEKGKNESTRQDIEKGEKRSQRGRILTGKRTNKTE